MVGKTGYRRSRTLAAALLPPRRGGLLEAVKRKIIGRLLLDGGTVEEPARGTRELDVSRLESRVRPPSRSGR